MTSKRRAGRPSTDGLGGFVFILPNLLGFLAFTLVPVIASLVLSFTNWDLITPAKFVGLDNFRTLFATDHDFWRYWGNTLFLMAGIPFSIVGSLMLAVALNTKLRGMVFFRTVYFLPTISAGVAIYVLWRWMYNPDVGIINMTLARIGIHGPQWLSSIAWAKPALLLMGIWVAMGGTNTVLYLAALQGISPELYEAAEIDGASRWRRLWHVTWPLVTPTTFFIGIMSVISGFQGGFEAAYVMTNGGPAGATTTVSFYIYRLAYEWYRMGYAAAVAWTLCVVIFAITLLNWRFGGRLVHY